MIYTLAGCEPGERCVIERTEEGFATRTENTGAANDWLVPTTALGGARRRRSCCSTAITTRLAQTAAQRREALAAWNAPFGERFDWVMAPVLNPFTRIAVEMCAAQGILRVVGYEKLPGLTCRSPSPSAARCVLRRREWSRPACDQVACGSTTVMPRCRSTCRTHSVLTNSTMPVAISMASALSWNPDSDR